MLRRSLLPSLAIRPASAPSYEGLAAGVQRFASLALVLVLMCTFPLAAAERTVRAVALGDSLTAGLGLPADAAFPVKLERALRDRGFQVEVLNAGVSGDTATRGLARLDWSVPEGTDAVIVELGANDMLHGLDPRLTRAALDEVLRRLKERRIEVLLAGMRSAPNFGEDYGRRFEPIYADL